MNIVKLVVMAKDLGLDEHYSLHKAGGTCGSAIHDCVTKTQVWRALLILELMIGGPQGISARYPWCCGRLLISPRSLRYEC